MDKIKDVLKLEQSYSGFSIYESFEKQTLD